MRRYRLVLLGLGMAFAAEAARAQPIDVPATWGGSLEARPRLTGAWGGARDELGKKGIVLDVDLLLTPQQVVSGGRSTDGDTWGNLEYTLNVDTQKAGWWPGAFLKFQGITGFGASVLRDSGAIVPVNTAALLPGINDHTTALTNATLMQFFSEKIGVVLGKLNTLDLGEMEFYGNYQTQFLNEALNSPMTTEQVPISTFGAGVVALPTKDLTLSALALNPEGTPTSNAVFGSGVLVLASATLTDRMYGLLGHGALSFSWSDKERYSLEQDPSNIARLLLFSQFPRLAEPGPILTEILKQYFPGLLVPTVPPNTKSSSWALSYSFDQYLWQPDKRQSKGIGIFLTYGVSDGNPNPIKFSFTGGIGGKGVVPGRADDTFGLGFATTHFSGAFLPFLREQLALGIDHETAFESYYNAALTGWLDLGVDLQVVNPAVKRKLTGTQLTSVDTAVIAGLRLRARF